MINTHLMYICLDIVYGNSNMNWKYIKHVNVETIRNRVVLWYFRMHKCTWIRYMRLSPTYLSLDDKVCQRKKSPTELVMYLHISRLFSRKRVFHRRKVAVNHIRYVHFTVCLQIVNVQLIHSLALSCMIHVDLYDLNKFLQIIFHTLHNCFQSLPIGCH